MASQSLDAIEAERSNRLKRFREIGGQGFLAESVPTADVNAESTDGIRVFYGGRGIWRDAIRTRNYAPQGVTIGVLHTGRHYDDDLAANCIEYHYPQTRSPGTDAAEVEATKRAAELNLPVFVVVQRNSVRDVYLGWVEDSSDVTQSFLIGFGEDPVGRPGGADPDNVPFIATTDTPRTSREVNARKRDPRFSFRVRQRYGTACAACGLDIPGLLDAAHIVSVADGGSDDPRNGLVMCPNHHRAFDQGLLTIDPETTLFSAPGGMTLAALGVTRDSLAWLKAQPHRQALRLRQAKAD